MNPFMLTAVGYAFVGKEIHIGFRDGNAPINHLFKATISVAEAEALIKKLQIAVNELKGR